MCFRSRGGRPAALAAGLVVLAAAAAGAPEGAGALTAGAYRQIAPRPNRTGSGTVSGTAFDSLAGRPLSGATVRVSGTDLSATTRPDGGFRIEGVPVGSHAVTLEHPGSSVWLTRLAGRAADVGAGSTVRVALAIPSARTLLSIHCPDAVAMVAGLAMDLLTLVPLPGTEILLTPTEGVDRTREGLTAEPDGTFAFCLREPGAVRLEAVLGEARSRPASLPVASGEVVARDVFVRATRPALVRGVVRDATSGEPVADVLIQLEGTRTRGASATDGRFVLSGVPPGEHTLVAEHVAYGEARGSLDVGVEDTVVVEVELTPEALAVADLEVVVRSRSGPRRMVTATRFDGIARPEIEAMLPRTTSFHQLLERANVPGLHVARVLYLDPTTGIKEPGVCVELGRRRSIFQDVCAGMVAVYLNDVRIANPEEFLLDLAPEAVDRFQLLSPLEALGRYGGFQSRNGVLLIYTRGN